MDPVVTPRLQLVPATADLVRCEIEDPRELFTELSVEPVPNWPPEALRDVLPSFYRELCEDSSLVGWLSWYWVHSSPEGRTLVGSGGFVGPPVQGKVEIGYETRAAYRRRGFATEAVDALVQWACKDSRVRTIVARVLPDNVASRRVLDACGFTAMNKLDESGMLRFERTPPTR
jgi:[ribosomal protein S5]-alanine N-acetyltransferase